VITLPYTLWELIEYLIEQPPFTWYMVKEIFPVDFMVRAHNDYYAMYLGGQVQLADQIIIGNIDIRIRHETAISKMLIFDIISSPTCITIKEIFERYPNVLLDDGYFSPTDVFTSYRVEYPWGIYISRLSKVIMILSKKLLILIV